jgi:hypothetical protein
LGRYSVPQLDWEVSISGSQRSNERVFPCLDCSFGGIHLVVVGFDQLQFALFLCEELLGVFRGLVVHYVEFDSKTFRGEFVKKFLICFEDGHVV